MKTVAGQVCVSKSRGAIIADNTWSCVRQIAEFKLTPEHAEQQWETLLMESELQELSSLLIHCRWSGKTPRSEVCVYNPLFFDCNNAFLKLLLQTKRILTLCLTSVRTVKLWPLICWCFPYFPPDASVCLYLRVFCRYNHVFLINWRIFNSSILLIE